MRTERRKVYFARDNSEHQTEDACVEHERELDHKMLVGLADDDVANALKGDTLEHVELRFALERVGEEAKRARKASGGSKRKARRDAPHLRAAS